MGADKLKEARQVAGAFAVYLAAVIVTGALLAPVLHAALNAITDRGILSGLADTPFRRVANRAFLLAALAGLYPFLQALQLRTTRDWGWGASRREALRAAGIGLGFGLLTMAMLVLAEVGLGILIHVPGRGWAVGAEKLAAGLLSGLVISVIEETFFRGALQSAWRRVGPTWGVAVPAVLYGALHFIRSQGNIETVRWWSGFALFGGAFDAFADPWTVGPLLTLIAVGVFLGLLREHYGHIFYGFGLHIGWVAILAVARKLTNPAPSRHLRWLIGEYDDVIGYLACAWILLLLGGWMLWTRRHRRCAS